DKELVKAGRAISIILGVIIVTGAMLIPRLGSYTGYILGTLAMLTGPLVLPTIWGLFSRKITLSTAWTVTILVILGGVFVKLGFREGGWWDGIGFLVPVTQLLQANERITEIVMGTIFPLFLLVIAELLAKSTSSGWNRVISSRNRQRQQPVGESSVFPARLCGWSVCVIALLMTIIAFFNSEEAIIIGTFAVVMFIIGFVILKGASIVKSRISETDRPYDPPNNPKENKSEFKNPQL